MVRREHILTEIRRLAGEQGHVPGRRSFATATGISESEWYGIYWARWNDAVRDAGLEPNEATRRIKDDELLISYATLIRKLQKVPTQIELRLAGRSGQFPSDSAFRKRFRTKADTLRALQTWLAEHNDFDDIRRYIPNLEEYSISDHEDITDGWVYLLKSGKNYKIGRGQDLERRVKQIATNYPEPVELVHAIRTDDPSGIECYWHRRFKEVRVRPNAEWFKLTSRQVRAFKRRKFQ